MRKISIKSLLILSVFLFGVTSINAQDKEQRNKIRKQYDLVKLESIRGDLQKKATDQKQEALRIAKEKGWKTRMTLPDGRLLEIQKVENGIPIYYTTFNVNAAKSTRTNYLNSGGGLGLDLQGQNMTAYIWDGGLARSTHQEYDGAGGSNRYSIGDGTTEMHFHAAHVTGTIIASGVKANAKGMAPYSKAIGYNWNNDKAEAITAAANGMLISNHSYGLAVRDQFGNPQLQAYYFGGYIDDSKDWDQIMFNAPNYLMVVAGGNDGNDNTVNSTPLGGNSLYDKLTGHSTSKNNLVVANAQGANIDANGNFVSVAISSTSSEGPTDDLRIKPDIAGHGTGVYSTYESSDNAYGTLSGTSMASPNVAGTLLLLQQHYKNINNSFMRAATLKGLVLHTADDAGTTGPNAIFGWGLLNAKKASETITGRGNQSKIKELTLTSGQTYTITVNSDGTSPLLASICWTDRPGTANQTVNLSTPVLVNDLDIRVTKSGTTYLPYKLTSVTANTKADNNVDPYERIDVASASGTYTITVTHKGTLTGGSQNFSLIVTGIAGEPVVCNATVPTGLSTSNITASGANVSWTAVPGATYDVRYRITGSSTWTTKAVSGTTTTLSGLSASSQYEVQVRSKCTSSNSAYSASVNFTTLVVQLNYCDSKGNSASDEYIQNVKLGTIDNTSTGGNGYSDHTSISTALTKGKAYTITITPKWTGTIYDEGYGVWIDYNKDGDFSDAGEQVWTKAKSKTTPVSTSFTVPASASTGATRMRVILRYNATPTVCGTYNYGETEDYTVDIGAGTPDTQAPTAPSNLTASNVAQTTLSLSWTASTDNVGVTGYDVYQGSTKITSTTSTSANITGLTAATAYTFSVKALDAAGNVSASSNVLSVTTATPDTQAPTAPGNLTASNVAQTTLSLSWTASTDNVGVTSYDVYQGSAKIASTSSTTANITGLTAATAYTFSVKAKDAAGNESAASNVLNVTTAINQISYCASKGNRATYEWIDYVSFGGMTNTTAANGGYGDFTSKIATVAKGSTNQLLISAGFSSSAYNEYWAVWIDFNHNGTFESGEKVTSGSSSSSANRSANISIPSSAVTGQTRMRVSMKYNSAPSPCETFADGEVEDYTVNITNATANTAFDIADVFVEPLGNEAGSLIFPNPATQFIQIRFAKSENLNYKITSLAGQVVKSGLVSDDKIDLAGIKQGVYLLEINDGQKMITTKFIKE